MPWYTCEDVDSGCESILEFQMKDVPKIGDVFSRNGRTYRRLVEQDQQAKAKADGAFWNWQVARNSDAAADCDFRNEKGVPGWKSRDSAREWSKRWNDKGLDADFDG